MTILEHGQGSPRPASRKRRCESCHHNPATGDVVFPDGARFAVCVSCRPHPARRWCAMQGCKAPGCVEAMRAYDRAAKSKARRLKRREALGVVK